MPLSKKQIAYGGVLVIAAGAFLWDRAASGSPDAAHAAAAATTPAAGAKPAESAPTSPAPAAGTIAPAAPRNALTAREGLGKRLVAVAEAREVDVARTVDAFAVSATWLPRQQETAAAKPTSEEEELEAARAFADKHVLNAVMVKSRGGYAMIDGQGVFVGNVVANYKLLAVSTGSATFGKEAVRIQLRLDAKPAVWREGATAEGRTGKTGGTARVE